MRIVLVAVMIAALAATLPAMAQEDTGQVSITTAYEAMQAAVQSANLEATAAQAQAIVTAAMQKGLANLTADEAYITGVANYYMMGMVFDQAIALGGLSAERQQFARKIADMVFNRQSVVIISHGEQFDIEGQLVPGKITVFDFFSKFCGPCMAIGPVLEDLATRRSDIMLVKVDINRPGVQGIDWASPVAQQFGLQSIPYFRIYDAEGKPVADGNEARGILMQWAQQLEQQ